jgi:hypothetical protein
LVLSIRNDWNVWESRPTDAINSIPEYYPDPIFCPILLHIRRISSLDQLCFRVCGRECLFGGIFLRLRYGKWALFWAHATEYTLIDLLRNDDIWFPDIGRSRRWKRKRISEGSSYFCQGAGRKQISVLMAYVLLINSAFHVWTHSFTQFRYGRSGQTAWKS